MNRGLVFQILAYVDLCSVFFLSRLIIMCDGKRRFSPILYAFILKDLVEIRIKLSTMHMLTLIIDQELV